MQHRGAASPFAADSCARMQVELQGFEGTRANLNGKIAFCGPLDPLKQKYPVTIDGSSVPSPAPVHHACSLGPAPLFPTSRCNRAASARRLPWA